ncbi:MAG: GTP-binding protein, partial [Oscillospiraceae bacterium]
MKVYESTKIKNIALAGHGGSGKTSLFEALLFKAGITDRLGKITEGNTVSDFNSEEVKRKCSIYSSLGYYERDDFKINLIDTPGMFDFAAEMTEGIWASGSVLITVSAKSGVKVGTEKAYDCAVE